MKHFCRISLFLSALLFLGVGRASADSLSYQLTGPVSLSFELPVNPTVTNVDLTLDFQVTPIDLTINGVASNDFLFFFSSALGGGFDVASCGDNLSCVDLALAGPQLYSGSEASPTMLSLFDVPLTNFDTGAPAGTISTTISTPEPSALALLSVGMLALSLVIGFKRSSPTAAS